MLQHKVNNIQETVLITSIENLSNECFYEIFDYLDGYHIYNAFSNLNYRFQQLLNSSSLLFKIKIDSPSNKLYTNIYKQITLMNKHQIFSFDLFSPLKHKQFFSSFSIDSSFDHLESLTLNYLDADVLMSILFNLSSLPRLFSLTINMWNVLEDLTDIYRTILALPMLKFFKFSIGSSDLSISLPIVTNKQFSTIEYLIMDHFCTRSELFTIISYTPQLRHLYFMHTEDDNSNIESILPMTLTNFSVCMYDVTFDEFEMFISKIYSKLKVLYIITYFEDIVYLNAARWEQFILQYLPQLEKFNFEYYEHIDYENESPSYFDEPNQFTSSFWIERRWLFEAKIDVEDIMYSVRPYKKRWYEYNTQHENVSSTQYSKSNRLTLTFVPSDECLELFVIDINRVLSIAQIYYLEIPKKKIFIGILIQIIDLLPELNSLKLHSLSLSEPRDLCEEEVDIFTSTEDTSKIINVYLEKMIDITEVYFLMALCPYMKFLKIGCINNMNVELFVQNILEKTNAEHNDHLRLLCFHVPTADDEIIQKLQKMIHVKKLLSDYTIKRIHDNIYLQLT
ncbi:unnamed protein product [Rotaria sp. Silwood1]|nr:unnamed protein product [Rotaria sp. Silwood1]